jgi:regulatory protein
VGRRAVARLRVADVERLGLHEGLEWTAKLARTVDEAVAGERARRAALTLLGRRARSTATLIDRLTAKGHDEATAQRVVQELVADGWMDDRAYAEALARELLAKAPATAKLIAHRLRQRGIDEQLAEAIAHEAVAETDLHGTAVELARKRLRQMENIPPATAARRIAGILARRGFDEDAVRAALHAVGLSPEDDA